MTRAHCAAICITWPTNYCRTRANMLARCYITTCRYNDETQRTHKSPLHTHQQGISVGPSAFTQHTHTHLAAIGVHNPTILPRLAAMVATATAAASAAGDASAKLITLKWRAQARSALFLSLGTPFLPLTQRRRRRRCRCPCTSR